MKIGYEKLVGKDANQRRKKILLFVLFFNIIILAKSQDIQGFWYNQSDFDSIKKYGDDYLNDPSTDMFFSFAELFYYENQLELEHLGKGVYDTHTTSVFLTKETDSINYYKVTFISKDIDSLYFPIDLYQIINGSTPSLEYNKKQDILTVIFTKGQKSHRVILNRHEEIGTSTKKYYYTSLPYKKNSIDQNIKVLPEEKNKFVESGWFYLFGLLGFIIVFFMLFRIYRKLN